MCHKNELNSFISDYNIDQKSTSRIAIIMAGNIPLVGFHDFLCVLLSGNHAKIKLSSDDKILLPLFLSFLSDKYPFFKDKYEFVNSKMKDVDAVIATGSDNSNLYFQKYFGHLPHVFRKNRTSLAVISENESQKNLQKLGDDIFDYFGRGCRNVTHLLVHDSFEMNRFFESIVSHGDIINHNKYGNNYDYNRAIHLMNQIPILDNNFVLLRESKELFSPLAMVHYHRYSNFDEVNEYIELNQDFIQVIVGDSDEFVPFGISQNPLLSDFADKIDTMKWLLSIK
tara:strand:- start:701 stop:1549 length:849 start_codon:yes stop_codon:yes gene_type:complete